jgi:hypothetical protein
MDLASWRPDSLLVLVLYVAGIAGMVVISQSSN